MKHLVQNLRGGDFSEYAAPTVEVIDVTVEQGFAQSGDYGTLNWAGQEIGEDQDYGTF